MTYGSASRGDHVAGDHGLAAPDCLETGPPLRLYVLGRFEAYAGDELVLDESWKRSKAKAILKLLALERRPLHRDELIEVLWPESEAAAGANSLRQSLYHLRTAFAAAGLSSPVAGSDESLSLCVNAWTDVGAFRSAATSARATRKDIVLYEAAIDLYGGDLLPHDAYEDWAQHPRDELRTLHLRLLSELADLCRSEGRCETAEELLLQVLQADPLREAEHRMLMRVYMHCGRRAEAVRQYKLCRRILNDELGVEPSAETEALYREIVNGDQETAPAVAAPALHPRSGDGRSPGPEIRHARTRDGVSIAYWTLGEGPPLLMMPTTPMSHLRMEWELPEWRRFFELLAEKRMLVRYDARGTGLSQTDGISFSLDNLALDLEAVADDLDLARFDLYASFNCGPLAITWAADHPERISRLVLLSCYASGREFIAPTQVQAVAELMRIDWSMYAQTMANSLTGWSGSDFAPRFATYVRDSVEPENAAAFFADAIVDSDATPRLGQIKAPTLVLHRRGVDWLKVEVAQRLATSIPRARLTLLDGTSALPFLEDTEAVVATIDEFLGEGLTRTISEERPRRKAPPVRYNTTSEGVSIAYWTLGDGPPLVVMPRLPFSHLEREWEIDEWRDWYQRLAASCTVIRYDARGAGLSQRSVQEYSLDGLVLDVDAVADSLGLDRFDLLGFGHSSPVAVPYAAERPQRVRRLVLWCPYASGRKFWRSSRTRAFQALRKRDWTLYTETAARALYGWAEGEAPARCAAMMRESMEPEMAETAFAAIRRFDIRRFIPGVKAPTLVMHRDGLPEFEVAQSRHVASLIPGARLSVLNGAEAVPFLGDSQAVVSAIAKFLG